MEKVRIGIIGIGNMGSAHAKQIDAGDIDGMTLAAVADLSESRRQWAKENLSPNVSVFDDGVALIRSDAVDAVLVAVPHYDHAPLTIEAFEKGLHVLCEKPVAVTTKQAQAMTEAADASGKVFAVMFNQRTNPLYREAKKIMDSGTLGSFKRSCWIVTDWYRSQSYYDSGSWRATWAGEGGGVLLNQCPHNLDLWQWICGMPQKVTAFCKEGLWHDIEVEDDVTAYVEYENGATGTFITTTGDTPGTNRLEIVCDGGKMVLDNKNLWLYRLETPESRFRVEYQGGFGEPEHTVQKVEIAGENPEHAGILRSFAATILTGKPLIADGREGIFGLTLSNAMHLSSWLKETVSLPIDGELFEKKLAEKVQGSQKKKEGKGKTFSLEGSY